MISMGRADIYEKRFMEIPEIAADIINAQYYDGKKVVKYSDLELVNPGGYVEDELGEVHDRRRDVFYKDWRREVLYAFVGIENQTDVNRIEPLREIGYDYAAYMKQVRNHIQENIRNGENQYGKVLKPEQKLIPVITICVYYGRHWDGPRTLWDMLDLTGHEDIKPFLMNSRLNLLELGEEGVYNKLSSDMRLVAKYIFLKGRGKEFNEFVTNGKEEIKYVEEFLDVMSVIGTDARYHKIKKYAVNRKEEGKVVNMCEVAEMLDQRGYKRGKEEGEQRGIDKLNRLYRTLVKYGRTDDMIKAMENKAYQKELFKEFDL